MALYVPDLSKDMLENSPTHPHLYWGLGLHKISVGLVLKHSQVPKTNLVGGTLRPLGMGPQNDVVISDLHPGRNRFCQRNISF